MAKVDDEIEIRTVYRAFPKIDKWLCTGCVALDKSYLCGTNRALCDMLSGKKTGACRDIIWVKEGSEVYEHKQ
jgi:hypothetical protein